MNKKKISFAVDIIREQDGKNYFVMVPSLPGCFSQGKTVEAAKKNILQAIKLHLKELKKNGERFSEVETYQTTIQVAA